MKLQLLIELDYDDEIMHGGDADAEAKTWFFDMLRGSTLVLHENDEVADDIGTVRILEINAVEPERDTEGAA